MFHISLSYVFSLGLVSAIAATGAQANETDLIVSKDCAERTACFATISEALEETDGSPTLILIEPGDYNEKVHVTQPNVTLSGAAPDKTRLHHDLVARDAKPFHRDGWGTPGSATLTINAANVTISDITVENTFDYLANDAKDAEDPEKVRDSQAVAVFLDTDSDRVRIDNVVMKAYQDTFFAHGERAYVSNGAIYGNVDFIFGDGQVVFEAVDIVSRPRGQTLPAGEIQSYITAPSTQIADDYGLVFLNCRLLREEGVPDRSVALGRPWHPTTTFPDGRYADPDAIGYTAFIDTYMDGHIIKRGWTTMNGTARDGSKSDIFRPEDSRFYERGSTGPGAQPLDLYKERRALPSSDSLESIRDAVLGDWDPS